MRAAAVAALVLLAATPALAVDRSAGATVPKPAASGAPWNDADLAALSANLDIALAGAATLHGAHVGLLAVDAHDDRVLYQRAADDLFQPASTFKLLAGSAALDALGPAYRFRTEATVAADGSPGPLALHGNGDILLDDAALASLPAALRAAGIARVHGVVADEPLDVERYLPGWQLDDLPWYYAAPVTRLGYRDNATALVVSPGANAGDPVTVNADALGFAVEVAATTGAAGSPSTLDVVSPVPARGASRLRVVGSLAAGAAPERLVVADPDPPFTAAAAARRALAAAGIAVDADAPPALATAQRVVWSHDSEPLGDLLADCWMPSDNLLAEELLRALGGGKDGPSTTADGIAAERAWLARLGVAGSDAVAISDGSGLSGYDRVTPRALVTVLLHDWDGPYRDLVLDDLPIAGVRGTLAHSFTGTGAERRVFAKSGSMSHVSALAGFVATQTHGTVAFAWLVDDWNGAPADLRDLRGRALAQIAGR